MSEFFTVSRQTGFARIALSRPEAANALGAGFWTEFPEAVRKLDAAPSVRALIITGEGKNFCGGLDVSSFSGLGGCRTPEERADFRRHLVAMQQALDALEESRLPTIAAIQGACVGAGLDLILACDIRIAAESAYFGVEETNLALVADLGSLQRGRHHLPFGIMAELAYTGRRAPAAELMPFGLLNAVTPDIDAAIARAEEIAGQISRKSPLTIGGVKRNLIHARDASIADGLKHVADWNAAMFSPEEIGEALTARAEKREPSFSILAEEDA
jgi:enoyl-CoA hydratase